MWSRIIPVPAGFWKSTGFPWKKSCIFRIFLRGCAFILSNYNIILYLSAKNARSNQPRTFFIFSNLLCSFPRHCLGNHTFHHIGTQSAGYITEHIPVLVNHKGSGEGTDTVLVEYFAGGIHYYREGIAIISEEFFHLFLCAVLVIRISVRFRIGYPQAPQDPLRCFHTFHTASGYPAFLPYRADTR